MVPVIDKKTTENINILKNITARPIIMGILNVTPDSFSDGGRYFNLENAVEKASQMVNDGADIIDVGGESSRPGAGAVTLEEELKRVIPVIKEISKNLKVKISCDTYKHEVAKEALEHGADMINDITGFRDTQMRKVAVDFNASICIMHMQGAPHTMQENPEYENVLRQVKDFLYQQARICQEEGIDPDKIIIDPGIGFGKTLEHNIEILANIEYFSGKYPIMIGASRKSFIEKILGEPILPDKRLSGSLAVATYCCLKDVSILRVHDVKETRDVIKVTKSLKEQER